MKRYLLIVWTDHDDDPEVRGPCGLAQLLRHAREVRWDVGIEDGDVQGLYRLEVPDGEAPRLYRLTPAELGEGT